MIGRQYVRIVTGLAALAAVGVVACGDQQGLKNSDTCREWLSATRDAKTAYVKAEHLQVGALRLLDAYCQRDSRQPQHVPLSRVVQLTPGG